MAVLYSPHLDGSAIVEPLRGLPCRVEVLPLGRAMSDELGDLAPNVLVVDHTADDFNVVRVVRELCQLTSSPIVLLAAAAESDDEQWTVDRLTDGAHVVIPRRASEAMVVAQVRAVLRGAPRPQPGPESIDIGDVTIDVHGHSLRIDGEPVNCSPVLFSLLVTLAAAPNRVLPREALLSRVWGVSPTAAHLRRVRIAASQLRRLLGEGPRRPRIETVARVGYRLAVEPG